MTLRDNLGDLVFGLLPLVGAVVVSWGLVAIASRRNRKRPQIDLRAALSMSLTAWHLLGLSVVVVLVRGWGLLRPNPGTFAVFIVLIPLFLLVLVPAFLLAAWQPEPLHGEERARTRVGDIYRSKSGKRLLAISTVVGLLIGLTVDIEDAPPIIDRADAESQAR